MTAAEELGPGLPNIADDIIDLAQPCSFGDATATDIAPPMPVNASFNELFDVSAYELLIRLARVLPRESLQPFVRRHALTEVYERLQRYSVDRH